jgi:diguanylate cyclase (GGDEF)-like protein/PAS domain S-box-containing protein
VKVKHADKQSSADADEMRRQVAEARYRTLFEHAPVGILISDAQSYCLDANASMCRMLGYTRAELIGLHASGIVVPTEIQHIAPALNDIKAKSDYHREWQFRRKDGSAFSAEVSATLMPDGTVLGMVSDITERKQAEQLLQTSEREQRQLSQLLEIERFRLVTAQRVAKIGSWETDIATMAIIWSEETYRIHETDPASFRPTHQGFMEYVHPEDRAAVDEAFRQSLNQRAACVIDHRLLMPGGRIKFVEERWQMFFDEGGQPTRAIGTCQDITERKETEARIAYLIHVYAMLSGINALIVRVHDRDELFREACRIAVEDGGFRMAMLCMEDRLAKKIVPVATAGKDEELLTSITERLSSSKDASNTMVALAIREKQAVVSNDSVNDPRVLFGKKYAESGVRSLAILPLIISGEAVGTLALYSSEVEFFHEEELKLLTELASDIAFAVDHIEKQERLNYLAYYDVLTGLANRNLLLERVAQYMRSAVSGGHKLALGLIDLERFKNFNDTLGRPTGDALLKQVAEWLTHKMGDINLLARVDADHFAIVLPEVKSNGNLARLVENLMAAFLGHSFRLNDAALRIGVKAGIALFPDDGTDADTLFKNAEAALKKAKSGGDRYLFYTQKMTEAVAAKLTLENQLREALDNEEFVLHYQPKVNLVSGKVTGAEALIRWNDPRTGLVPPGQFIPILEETGLIYEVGRWALRKAIEDYLRWRSAGLPALRIAVNVSPLQLRNPGFVAEIERNIAIDPHAAEGLELEITESMIMEDVRHNIASLQAIRAMGITIAIDDFGTGFSSLGYLSKLPVDTLKVDRSFVRDRHG